MLHFWLWARNVVGLFVYVVSIDAFVGRCVLLRGPRATLSTMKCGERGGFPVFDAGCPCHSYCYVYIPMYHEAIGDRTSKGRIVAVYPLPAVLPLRKFGRCREVCGPSRTRWEAEWSFVGWSLVVHAECLPIA